MEENQKVAPNNPNVKKGSARWMITTVIILLIVVAGIWIFWAETPVSIIDNSTAVCIAENSEVYILSTCGASNKQKALFGEYVDLLNMTDCIDNPVSCTDRNIQIVPTWIIDGDYYTGVRTIEGLKNLTGC